ncbi:MAG: hypothetical protein HRU15_19885, partial [Planctomycetes bacterium]|nr:hypothetical protein [Planctomycetota bacterium]
GVDAQDIALIANKQAFAHAVGAHQNLQAIRELDSIRISSSFCQTTEDAHYVQSLLHGLGIASGKTGSRAQIVSLPQIPSDERRLELLDFYTRESSSLGIERILLDCDLGAQNIQDILFALMSSPLFIQESERLMLLSVCTISRQEHGAAIDKELAAYISWILGAPRAQANADTQEAWLWLQDHSKALISYQPQDNAPELNVEQLAAAIDGSIHMVFEHFAQWLQQGISAQQIIACASQYCARRLHRLALNNGGLWRDAGRGIRLCHHMALIVATCEPKVSTQCIMNLAFYLFESRWLQHSSGWTTEVIDEQSTWKDFAAAYDRLDLRTARHIAISLLSKNKDFSEFLAILLRDDHNYEQLSTLHAVCSEAAQQESWQPYIAGMIAYAIDQRSSRNALAAAQFGSSFINDSATNVS